jgi:hypothetical protein
MSAPEADMYDKKRELIRALVYTPLLMQLSDEKWIHRWMLDGMCRAIIPAGRGVINLGKVGPSQ